jgi:hypothetical protein
MAAIRKSSVSKKGTWFSRNSNSPSPKGRLSQNEATPVPNQKQQPPSKKSPSVPASNPKGGLFRVPVMPNSGTAPSWLLRFCTLHRHSSLLAFVLVATTLVVYGWTVYSRGLWIQSSRNLKNLQRQERQLTATNATLTNKMAEDAQRASTGLISPTPGGAIFLRPASANPKPVIPSTMSDQEIEEQKPSPLGY